MKRRAGWRVDLKWVFGIIFTLVFMVATVFYSLSQITTKDKTLEIVKVMGAEPIEKMVSSMYPAIQAYALASPSGEIPIPGTPIKLKSTDVLGKSKSHISNLVLRKLGNTLYDDGLQAFSGFKKGDPQQEGLGKSPSSEGFEKNEMPEFSLEAMPFFQVLAMFNRTTHKVLQTLFIVFIALSVFFGGFFIIFSYRFGRLISPGVSLFIVGLSGFGPNGLITFGSKYLPVKMDRLFGDVFLTYLILLGTGVLLITVGAIANIIYWIIKRKKSDSYTTVPDSA